MSRSMTQSLTVEDEDSIKVVTVGDGAVGKTCLLVTYVDNTFPEEYAPTVFETHSSLIEVDGQRFTLSLWDTAGQEEMSDIRPLAYTETDVFLVCYNISNKLTLKHVQEVWVPEIREADEKARVILVGTMLDLRERAIKEKTDLSNFVTKKEAEKVRKEIKGYKLIECSALLKKNITNVFEEVGRCILEERNIKLKEVKGKKSKKQSVFRSSTIERNENKEKNKEENENKEENKNNCCTLF